MASSDSVVQGTVLPVNLFNPDQDAVNLRKAMKGLGTDEQAIIDILCYRSNDQRQQIKRTFKTKYGRDLIKDLKSELSGRFEDVMVGLMLTPTEYDATELHKAISGLRTDKSALIEILCTRNNEQIHAIRDAYKTLFHKDLENDICGDTSGNFKELLVSLSKGERMENMRSDPKEAKKDASALQQAGERFVTDYSKFIEILASRSFDQLQLIKTEYHRKEMKGRTLEQGIKRETSGYLQKGLLAIVSCAHCVSKYFAEELYKSMKGAGTNDSTLVRVVVSRCEVDMVKIKRWFTILHGKTVWKFIKDDCSGDYKRALLALVGDG